MGRVVNTERVEFGKSILLLATALGFDLDEPVIGVYWHALKEVPADVRREAFTEASKRKWFKFPKPADVSEIAASIIAVKRTAVFKEITGSCQLQADGRCSASFFIEDESGRTKRCECWADAQRAMDRVGQAIALPPARPSLNESEVW